MFFNFGKFSAGFIEMIRRANLEPTKKYKSPQTSSHEYSWLTTPLVCSFINLIICYNSHMFDQFPLYPLIFLKLQNKSLKTIKETDDSTFIVSVRRLVRTLSNTIKCFQRNRLLLIPKMLSDCLYRIFVPTFLLYSSSLFCFSFIFLSMFYE